ncbi:hypothetical protein NDA13_002442 [Ustilago tritici]|nr:hypothetical protein NDA13_002442 [Ustilago tritici]
MALERTGGAGDRGIDLRGWWSPPQSSNRIRILAQCKCQDEGGKKMGPVLIREMEGVIFRASSPSSDTEEASAPTAGIILSSSGFSKQALLQVRSSGVALAAMHVLALPQVEVENREEGELVERCVSIVWNIKFGGAYGLLEGGMEARWVRSIGAGGGSAMGRPVIYRGGRPI